eukprot:828887-Rhodomonas_salina.2
MAQALQPRFRCSWSPSRSSPRYPFRQIPTSTVDRRPSLLDTQSLILDPLSSILSILPFPALFLLATPVPSPFISHLLSLSLPRSSASPLGR